MPKATNKRSNSAALKQSTLPFQAQKRTVSDQATSSKKGATTSARQTKKPKVIEVDSSDDESMDDVREVDEIEEFTSNDEQTNKQAAKAKKPQVAEPTLPSTAVSKAEETPEASNLDPKDKKYTPLYKEAVKISGRNKPREFDYLAPKPTLTRSLPVHSFKTEDRVQRILKVFDM
jgi:hypothetical protein